MQRLLLAAVLLLILAGSAWATDITVGSFTISNSHGYSSAIRLRIYYTGCPSGQPFLTNDSQSIMCGSIGSATGFYKEVVVSVNSGILTIPAFVLPSTDNALPPTVRASAVFFVGGARRDNLFSNWVITNTLGSSVTFAALYAYQPNVVPSPPPATYLTAAQISALITAAVPSITKASTSPTYGITALSVSPASSADPIAVGTNDTRVPTQGENDALVGTDGTPSSSNKYITNSDTRNTNTRTPTDGTVTDAKITAGGLSPSKITGTAVITSDSRLSDARTPTGAAGGASLGGTYPNPSIVALPAISGANLTNLTSANLSGALPAISGAALTNLNGSNITSGSIPAARLPLEGIIDAVKTGGLSNNAVVGSDGVTTASSTTFSSAAHPCVIGDVGKSIIIYAAGSITSVAITATTNANPAVITTSPAHGFSSGMTIVLAGYSSTLGTALNGGRIITVLSGTTFSVPVDTTASSAYSGSGATASLTGLNNSLRTTISSCSGNNFVLGAAATATTSGSRFVYGTLNTSPAQTLMSSLTSGGNVFLPPGGYMLGAVTLLSHTTVFAFPGTVTLYSTASSVFTFSSQTDVTISGINFDAGGNPLGNGAVTLVGGTVLSRIRIDNNIFTDSFLTNNVAPVTTFNRHGVLLRDQSDVWVNNNLFEHALRIKAAGGTVGEQRTYITRNTLRDTNENGISLLTGQAVTVRDIFIWNNTFDGIMTTGNGITIGDDGGGGVTQAFINIQIIGNNFKGQHPSNTAWIQDKGSGTERNINISFNNCDDSAGSTESTTMCVNKANQGTTSATVNFTAIGNTAYGYYDYAAFRYASIGSGVISDHSVTMSTTNQRCMRFGNLANTVVANNLVSGCGLGLVFNAGTYTNVTVEKNTVGIAAANNAEGIYVDAQTAPIDITFDGNKVYGPGGTFTNVYGIEDAENAGGDTDTVRFLNMDFRNMAVAASSRNYQTMATHATITEVPSGLTPLTLTNNSATPTVRGQRNVKATNSGATTITNLLNGYPGQVITITATNGNSTIQNNANIILSKVDVVTPVADFVMAANNTLTLMTTDGLVWTETGRGWQ